MENEIFKDIPGFEGYYQVSNLGNVKSLERIAIRQPARGNYLVKERILKPSKDGGGYLHVILNIDGKKYVRKNHVLVAMAFLGHIRNGHVTVVDHINNEISDNRLENLQLITQRQNASKDKKGYSSKYVGVYYQKNRKKWIAQIIINKKHNYLGSYKTEIEAHKAYEKALSSIK